MRSLVVGTLLPVALWIATAASCSAMGDEGVADGSSASAKPNAAASIEFLDENGNVVTSFQRGGLLEIRVNFSQPLNSYSMKVNVVFPFTDGPKKKMMQTIKKSNSNPGRYAWSAVYVYVPNWTTLVGTAKVTVTGDVGKGSSTIRITQ